jgi:hypothetical protein
VNHREREAAGLAIVDTLGAELRAAGHNYEEIICVLLHALRLAEAIGAATERRSALRPPGMPTASQVIANCKAELARRAG